MRQILSTPAPLKHPWTPFCLSSSGAGPVDLFLAAHDDAVDFASDVALQDTDNLKFQVSLGNPARNIGLGLLLASEPPDGDDVQSAVGSPVAATVEPMPDGLFRRKRAWD